MKKIILIIMLLFICSCGLNDVSTKGDIILSGTKKDFYMIYKVDDRVVYSTYSNTQFKDENNNLVDLKEALENKKITIEDVISNMDYYNAANDGGSLFYKSKNGKVFLAKCNSLPLNGNIKDIYITDDEEVLNYCTN